MSDFAFDETVSRTNFPYQQIKNGDIIFVKTDYLNQFFHNIHPKINASYIIVSHNSDYPAPGKFRNMLDDDKIIAWFAQNPDYVHDKLIPIGLENRYYSKGRLAIIKNLSKSKDNYKKKNLLYMNFTIGTYPAERVKVYNYFKNKDFCQKSKKIDYKTYLQHILQSHFVLSPRGNGLDCHRTWEILYLNSIPIVKTSPMDKLFLHLPVVIIHDWKEVTKPFLEMTLIKFNQYKTTDTLWMDYWIDFIKSLSKKYKKWFLS